MKKSIHSAKATLLCDLLRDGRIKAGITQQQLADMLGRPQSFVAKYELGERRLDVIEFLIVAKALGLDPMKTIKKLI